MHLLFRITPFLSLILMWPAILSAGIPSSESDSSIGFTAPPRLLASPRLSLSVNQIRTLPRAVVTADLIISGSGTVDSVAVLKSTAHAVDSIVVGALYRFRFEPMRDHGDPVPSIMTFEYVFDPSTIIKTLVTPPSLIVRLLERSGGDPVRDCPVSVRYVDTIGDPQVIIPFFEFLDRIGCAPGQRCVGNRIIAKTDSEGYARFSLLPAGAVVLDAEAPWYRVVPQRRTISKKHAEQIEWLLDAKNSDPFEKRSRSEYEVMVYSDKKRADPGRIDIERIESETGLTDDVVRVLAIKSPSIVQVNERPSNLLVHGQGMYDNLYLVNGVSMFAPVHFTNDAFYEIPSFMVTTMADISVTSSRQCGRYAGAPGTVIEYHPSIVPFRGCSRERSQLLCNLSNRQMDFSLIQPVHHGRDWYQFSGRFANCALLFDRKIYQDVNSFGFDNPRNYQDFAFNSHTAFRNFLVKTAFWLSSDGYYSYNPEHDRIDSRKLWGTGSLSVEGPLGHTFSIGAASQNEYRRKGLDTLVPLNAVTRRTGSMSFSKVSDPLKMIAFDYRLSVDLLDWTGTLGEDSKWLWEPPGSWQMVEAPHNYRTAQGTELHITAHSGISATAGSLTFGSDLLGGMIAGKSSVFIDPGLWTKYALTRRSSVGASVGAVTTFPDIRGLPDPELRSTVQKSYQGTFRLSTGRDLWLDCYVEPYIRWRPHTPLPDTSLYCLVWDHSRETGLLSRGADLYCQLRWRRYLTFSTSATFGQSDRIRNHRSTPYEYSVPWSVRSNLKVSMYNETINLLGSISASKSLQYFDYADHWRLKENGIYFRPDITLELHSRELPHPWVRRFDTYITVQNIAGLFDHSSQMNNGEPYWRRGYTDNSKTMRPVPENTELTHFTISWGGRLFFHLW